MTDHQPHPWMAELPRHEKPHSLISIARQGRLVREGPNISQRVHINAVDECVLTLVDLARTKRRNICILYPAPAGDVSVLLAAQLLLQALIQQAPSARVGLLTADVVGAARAWHELRVVAGPTRTALSEAFPCIRATPEGRCPLEDRQFKGVIVGNRFSHWPVGFIIVDHLAGFVGAETSIPVVHIFADPLDPALETMANAGELIWGFAPSELLTDDGINVSGNPQFSPFSVAEDRLRVIHQGVRATIDAVRHPEAERCATRIREDLKTLTDLCGPSPPRTTAKGLRVAWQHFTTLLCLPCQPHVFDQFAGLPPIAARATTTFEPEISAWSRTLGGDAAEFGSVLASDLGELRALLDGCNLFLPKIAAVVESGIPTLCVVRTHTAARALMHLMANDSEADHVGSLHVRAIRRLNREASWPRTIVVGLLPRWEWHRVDSGLAPDLSVLVLGSTEVRIAESMLIASAKSRTRWASTQVRGSVFRELFGMEAPADGATEWLPRITVTSSEIPSALDPLSHFHAFATSSPLLVGDEGVEEAVAEESETGVWAAAVDAVDVSTSSGKITLATNRSVEVRQGDKIVDCIAELLKPGMYLLIGKREGRLGLLEAMAERLQKTRPTSSLHLCS